MRNALDGLHGDAALAAQGIECVEVGGIALLRHHRVAVGQEHRVEGVFPQAFEVTRCDVGAVARHADEAGEPGIACFHEGFEGAAGAERNFLFVRFGEVVQLDQVHAIHAETLQRARQAVPGAGVGARAGLGGEEERVGVALQPRGDAKFRVAVAGGGVDVVDAELEQDVEHLVGAFLLHAAKAGSAEDRACTAVAGATELDSFDHWVGSWICTASMSLAVAGLARPSLSEPERKPPRSSAT